jgi:hypothetical protein
MSQQEIVLQTPILTKQTYATPTFHIASTRRILIWADKPRLTVPSPSPYGRSPCSARLDPGDHQPAAAATGLPAGVTGGISVHNPGAVTLVNWQQADHTN